jgi:hypothetical protein
MPLFYFIQSDERALGKSANTFCLAWAIRLGACYGSNLAASNIDKKSCYKKCWGFFLYPVCQVRNCGIVDFYARVFLSSTHLTGTVAWPWELIVWFFHLIV